MEPKSNDRRRRISRTLKSRVISVTCILLVLIAGGATVPWLSRKPNVPVLLDAAAALYTHHVSHASQTEIIRLQIDPAFSDRQRSDIVRAVSQWNYVLNSHMRFEVTSGSANFLAVSKSADAHRTWFVARQMGGSESGRRDFTNLAVTIGTSSGVVALYVDRVPTWMDPFRIVLHELGHTLGLQHDSRSHLMSAHYWGDDQKCIDLVTVEQLSAILHLPRDELNWCTDWDGGRDVSAAGR